MPDDFNSDEADRIAQAVATGRQPTCPSCEVVLDSIMVPPRTDVSYVRDRVWLACASCHRRIVIDRPRT